MKLFLKQCVEKLPYSVGRLLALVPFKYRFGSVYMCFSELVGDNERAGDRHAAYVVEHFSRICE